ncbi:hypothetical protein [Thermococcus sp.]|uniref:hypothetical protein n=1 Tax=Thermococcus sp. TaxID=35749 RepID=UPI002605FC1E|nr:hypothetical protein [Thermococcus sp.]
MEVPLILFRTARGRFAVDAYFTEFVSLEPRKVLLIKDPSKEALSETAGRPLPVLLREDVGEFLRRLFLTLEESSREARDRRISHLRRWNVLRIIGIPTGHSRHIATDERLGEIERESSFGLALLKGILGVTSSGELAKVPIIGEGVAYRKLWVEDGKVKSPAGEDTVYTGLLRKDSIFRTAFFSALFRDTLFPREMEERGQAFP